MEVKYYEIIKVKHGSESLNELQLTFGPINLINKTDLFIKKWEEVKGKLLKVLENFKGSEIEKSKISKEIETIESVIN